VSGHRREQTFYRWKKFSGIGPVGAVGWLIFGRALGRRRAGSRPTPADAGAERVGLLSCGYQKPEHWPVFFPAVFPVPMIEALFEQDRFFATVLSVKAIGAVLPWMSTFVPK
jgi:hypothetical protein